MQFEQSLQDFTSQGERGSVADRGAGVEAFIAASAIEVHPEAGKDVPANLTQKDAPAE